MKTFKITLLAALISSPLAAETIDKTWELGVFGEYIKSSTDKDNATDWNRIEAGKGIGIDLQKFINDKWNARIELARTRYDVNNGNDKDYGSRYGIDAIYKLEDSNLYLFAGVKRFNNIKSYNAIDAGLGYNFQINDRFALYSEAAVYRDVDYGYTEKGFKLGVKYAFGDVKKSVKQDIMPTTASKETMTPVIQKLTMIDSDNDGVNDKEDKCNNTPENVKVDSKGCSLYSEKTVEVNLNVKFENNSSQLKAEMLNDIQRLAAFMEEYKNTTVMIEGHSSAVGDAAYNLMISQKRADAIKNILINQFNIDATRLTAKGFGETELISTGNTLADNKANRRVVAKIATTIKEAIVKG